jgi:hypothetical protein
MAQWARRVARRCSRAAGHATGAGAYPRAMTTAMPTALPPSATIQPELVEVEPGADSGCVLDVRNVSDIVESYRLEVLGDAAAWTTLEPPTVSVFPGDAARVVVRFHPPRDGRVPAADVPFAIRVTPSQAPAAAVVPEGVVRVAPYTATTAEIRPRTSVGRGSAKHLVAVDNRGNLPLDLAVGGTDPDDAVTVAPRPPRLAVAAGQAAFVKVRVKHRHRLWRGDPVTRPFQVHLLPENAPPGTEPVTLDATTVQQPMIPRGAGRVLAALVALALLGAGLWFGLLKPAVESTAEEAAEDAVQQPLSEVAAEAGQAAEAANQAQEAVNGAGSQPAPTESPEPGSGSADGAGTEIQHRFETLVDDGGTVTSPPLAAPEDATLAITDLVLQNPQGDSGRLDVLVDGVAVHIEALQNFRSLDYHLVTPIQVAAGENLAVRTTCTDPGETLAGFTGAACRVFVLVIGVNEPLPVPDEGAGP